MTKDVSTAALARISGLAATEKNLFVSDTVCNCIRVYDANAMTPVRTFPLEQPGKLTVDRDGNLWIAQTSTGQIRKYNASGKQLGTSIAAAAKPTALAIDNTGRLMVADSGPSQQINFYKPRVSLPAHSEYPAARSVARRSVT